MARYMECGALAMDPCLRRSRMKHVLDVLMARCKGISLLGFGLLELWVNCNLVLTHMYTSTVVLTGTVKTTCIKNACICSERALRRFRTLVLNLAIAIR